MAIKDEIKTQLKLVLSQIPGAIGERIEFLKNNRIGSEFDKRGAVQYLVGLEEQAIFKKARGVIFSTYSNPYLTDQEKLDCLLNDGPEVYVMEACILLAEAFENHLDSKEFSAYIKEYNKDLKESLRKEALKASLDRVMKETLDWVTPTTLRDMVVKAQETNSVRMNHYVFLFLDNLTVAFFRQKIINMIEIEKEKPDGRLIAKKPQEIADFVLKAIMKTRRQQVGESIRKGMLKPSRPSKPKFLLY